VNICRLAGNLHCAALAASLAALNATFVTLKLMHSQGNKPEGGGRWAAVREQRIEVYSCFSERITNMSSS